MPVFDFSVHEGDSYEPGLDFSIISSLEVCRNAKKMIQLFGESSSLLLVCVHRVTPPRVVFYEKYT
jgi:hypothetical protein